MKNNKLSAVRPVKKGGGGRRGLEPENTGEKLTSIQRKRDKPWDRFYTIEYSKQQGVETISLWFETIAYVLLVLVVDRGGKSCSKGCIFLGGGKVKFTNK